MSSSLKHSLTTRFIVVCLSLIAFAANLEARCPSPSYVQNGFFVCDSINLENNVTCRIDRCYRGYEVKGASEILCLSNGKWSDSLGKCEAVTCPPLKRVPFARVSPDSCYTKPSRFDRVCRMTCPPGYSGEVLKYCSEKGQWIGRDILCEDVQPPVMKCPHDITVSTDPGRPTAKVTLPVPSYSDNSKKVDPNARLTFQASVPLQSDMKIGRHYVTYTVKDKAGLETRCYFIVVVEDKEPPKFTFCPSNITKIIKDQTIRIAWKKPTATDNSGKVDLYSSVPIGSTFYLGKTPVVSVATDKSFNKAECRFNIYVKRACIDANLPFPLSCEIPAADPSKCKQATLIGPAVLWESVCRKTCKVC